MSLRSSLIAGLCAAAVSVTAVVIAGPLDPPAGGVAPTYKTLAEIEPRIAVQSLPGDATALHIITQPGSYYLTGNLTYQPGKRGIVIDASNVRLDLNGHTILSTGSGTDGVTVESGRQHVEIINGTIKGWSQHGIVAHEQSAVLLRDVTVSECIQGGATLGVRAVVESCRFENNASDGLSCLGHSKVSNTTAIGNGGHGIVVGDYSLVTDCVGSINNWNGISTGIGTTVSRCAMTRNNQDGLVVGSGSTINACTASSNLGEGVHVTGNGCTVTGTTSRVNRLNGFRLNGANNLVNGCVAEFHSFSSDAAGVYVQGGGNRVDECVLSNNNIGVRITSTGNLVARCSFSFNPTRVSAAAGNSVAEIIVSPDGAFTTGNAWANFGH